MTDNKLTDEQIIKAWECCASVKVNSCGDCPFKKLCFTDGNLHRYTLDLFNRQKAEIERLECVLMGVMHSVDKWLEGDELKQDEVNRAATMREKTLQMLEDSQDGHIRTAVEKDVEIDKLKAEIERLQKENKTIRYCYQQAKSYNNSLAESCEKNCKKFNMITRAEARKELANSLEYFAVHEDPEINAIKCKDYESYMGGFNQFRLQIVKGINNLLKEMDGE